MKARIALFAAAAFLLQIGFAVAQEQHSWVEEDEVNDVLHFKWQGLSGWTYFVQHSEDLVTWNWLPEVISGNGSVNERVFTSTGTKIFLRLKCSDIPTTNPEGDDFDGDGIGNLWEVQHGMSPFSLDSDGDGMPDGWEVAQGLDGASAEDAQQDPDDDGLSNLGEYLGGYDAHMADSDGDGLMDGWSRGSVGYDGAGRVVFSGGETFVADEAGNVASAGAAP